MVIVDSDESLILRMLVEIDIEIDSKARRHALPSIHVLPFVEILAEDIGVPDPRIELVLISLIVSLSVYGSYLPIYPAESLLLESVRVADSRGRSVLSGRLWRRSAAQVSIVTS